MLILLTGKGGVGKTTLTALLAGCFVRAGKRPLLIDADPAMTLHWPLGIPEPRQTVAGLRETIQPTAQLRRELAEQGQTLSGYVQTQLQERGVLQTHHPHFDYLALGRGEGAGCYCQINRVLGEIVPHLLAGYELVLMDCEAGLEHLARLRITAVDWLLLVSEPTPDSLSVAERMQRVIAEVGMQVGQMGLVVNKGETAVSPAISSTLPIIGIISHSRAILERRYQGEPLLGVEIPEMQDVFEFLSC